MKTTLSSKGQIVLPAEFREQDRIQSGQQFTIERIEAGEYLLKRIAIPENKGFAEWILACPVKDWFKPIPSESTDSITTPKL
jgi:AbrB family looped-hinge helix DNA binding protein